MSKTRRNVRIDLAAICRRSRGNREEGIEVREGRLRLGVIRRNRKKMKAGRSKPLWMQLFGEGLK